MPEGPTLHRAAREQRPHLKGKALAVSSPQGRFAEGAERLDGRRCTAVEAYGKHLLYGFGAGLSLHIHLGLFGRIRTAKGGAPEPRGLVRVRLEAADTAKGGYTVDINGPAACAVLDKAERAALLARIGPDPLRADADPEAAWAAIHRRATPVGVLLMDQAVISGLGNIYRCELLWRERVHPCLPGKALERPVFDRLWGDAARFMGQAVEQGFITTVEPPPKTRRAKRFNIYKKPTCPRCGGPIRVLMLAGRKCYVCEHDAPPP